VGGEERGYDGGKQVKGRKRHILLDMEGFLLSRREGPRSQRLRPRRYKAAPGGRQGAIFPRLSHLWLDAGYNGKEKGKDWVQRRSWAGDGPDRRQASQAVGEGAGGRGAATLPEGLHRLAEEVGGRAELFVDGPKPRRMSKDYERVPGTGEALMYVAMTCLMVRRLARS
jgi:putative transposase